MSGHSAEKDAPQDECGSCGEGMPNNECPRSRRSCGHHCNHTWTHDECDWCGLVFGDANDDDPTLPGLLEEARKARPSCRFGPTEHDGSRFCHEHVGRVHAGSPTPWRCDESEGCCSACRGSGADQSGPCSDCYGTGHAHPTGGRDA